MLILKRRLIFQLLNWEEGCDYSTFACRQTPVAKSASMPQTEVNILRALSATPGTSKTRWRGWRVVGQFENVRY